MYLPSMPAIAKDLHLTSDQIQSTLTLWFLGASSLQFVLGPVSDRYGRKNVIVLGGLLFVASSAVCAIANSLAVMLVARFIQGLAICSLVAAYAAIHELFSNKRAVKILALIGAVTILAPALGPLFGAMIVQFASWRYIFWVLAIMGAVGVGSLWAYMPDSINAPHPFDIKKIIRNYGHILRNKDFMLANICYCFLVTIFFLWMFESPFIIINIFNKSTLFYGIAQTLIFSCFFVGAVLTKWILENYKVVHIIRVFMLLTIASALMFVLCSWFYNSIYLAVICMMLISAATSMLFGLINRVAIDSSRQPMGMRTAVFSTTISLFGFITGVVLGVIDAKSLLAISLLSLGCVLFAAVLIYFTHLPDFSNESE